MQEKFLKNENQLQKYPEITEELIECLRKDFPDKLPRNFKDAYEFGVLVGQQQVIDKLVLEKQFNETSETEGEKNV